ncbi:uncharacterized protein LOC129594776 isoform X2 [Paramacrobiotus metropolitanus]|uniref:uncharacterized protein LOC129594776 isoform X2 n=1 Tax=Paramacrobiotus metropolitanus TaxID=2943436 RepID=UPI0024462828|nr:uncharacterized protein LOC129594776 isoform X2 [Paramacrobiotus metropolitanus]
MNKPPTCRKLREQFHLFMPSAYVTYEAPPAGRPPVELVSQSVKAPTPECPLHATPTSATPSSHHVSATLTNPQIKNLAAKPPTKESPRQNRLDSWLNSTANHFRSRKPSRDLSADRLNRNFICQAREHHRMHSCDSSTTYARSLDPPPNVFRPATRNVPTAIRLRSAGPPVMRQPSAFSNQGLRSSSIGSSGLNNLDMYHSNGSGNPSSSHLHAAIIHSHSQSSSIGTANGSLSSGATSSTPSTSTSNSGGPAMPNGAHNVAGGISRKKIISKSQEAGLNHEEMINEEEDDVWYDKDVLFRHHLREVLEKWQSIDDEIWGKIICMEKNRRVAKAYARVPVLTINGGEDGFDGYRIGLSGFENPKRHPDTTQSKKLIGQGIKLKMDNDGNILVRRASPAAVYVRNTTGSFQDDNCFSSEVIKLQGQLEADKPFKVFDMKRFTLNIAKEMKGAYPDRRKLELQCFTNIAFAQQEADHLETPCWIMVINIVALDMLKNKLPTQVPSGTHTRGLSVQPRMPAMMENVHTKRFLSTPRDEHYPRLLQQQLHSVNDITLAELLHNGNDRPHGTDHYDYMDTKSGEYVDDMDDRASVSTYNFIPGYRPSSSLLPGDYDVMHTALPGTTRNFRAPLHAHVGQDGLYRTMEQQHYPDAYFADMANAGLAGYGITSPVGGSPNGGYRTPLPLGLAGQHAATEPNFKMATGRNFAATPALQRFAPHHRHSRSYDSGLESDMTSSSDETDYNRWTCYSRLHMLPHARTINLSGATAVPRLQPEWE